MIPETRHPVQGNARFARRDFRPAESVREYPSNDSPPVDPRPEDSGETTSSSRPYVLVPRDICARTDLSDHAKLAWIVIQLWTWNGTCPTNAAGAAACGWLNAKGKAIGEPAVSTFKRAIRELEAAGLVKREVARDGWYKRTAIKVEGTIRGTQAHHPGYAGAPQRGTQAYPSLDRFRQMKKDQSPAGAGLSESETNTTQKNQIDPESPDVTRMIAKAQQLFDGDATPIQRWVIGLFEDGNRPEWIDEALSAAAKKKPDSIQPYVAACLLRLRNAKGSIGRPRPAQAEPVSYHVSKRKSREELYANPLNVSPSPFALKAEPAPPVPSTAAPIEPQATPVPAAPTSAPSDGAAPPLPAPPVADAKPRRAKPSPPPDDREPTEAEMTPPQRAFLADLTPDEATRFRGLKEANRAKILAWFKLGHDQAFYKESMGMLRPPRGREPAPSSEDDIGALLESLRVGNPTAPQDLARRLAVEFADRSSYRGFLSKCNEVYGGRRAVADLEDAYRQATSKSARNPGAVFMHAIKAADNRARA